MENKRIDFEKKWGMRCNDIADAEETTPEAIRMRVKRFGNPWQRRAKETMFEEKYGKTLGQLALDMGIHPVTIARREKLYGDVYYETPYSKPAIRGKIINERGEHWTENSKMHYVRIASTYMDQHEKSKTKK